MPELPEVETTRRGLEKSVLGRRIATVDVRDPMVVKGTTVQHFRQQLAGFRITSVQRRGKFLIFYLSSKKYLLAHLRMTGQFIFANAQGKGYPKAHVVFCFSDKTTLYFLDQRKFGELWVVGRWQEHPGIAKLGPEPLGDTFSLDWFKEKLKHKTTVIKNLLLDQTFVAGLGNIYVNEALFAAGIHPLIPACEIGAAKATKLYHAIQNILQQAIDLGGSSIRNYVDISGSFGSFQLTYKVYGREGQPCVRCAKILCLIRIGGRSSVCCESCQVKHKKKGK